LQTRDNEHLQRETQLLKAFFDRAQRQQQQQQQLDAGVLADAHGKVSQFGRLRAEAARDT
jgi:hypothetical protein